MRATRQTEGLAKLHQGLVKISRFLVRKKPGQFRFHGGAEPGLM